MKGSMTRREPLRVALLLGWRAVGLDELFAGKGDYEVVAGVVSEPGSSAASFLSRCCVPWLLRDLPSFCLRRGVPLSDPETRRMFDTQTAEWVKTFRPDLIVLYGYGYRLAEPFLDSWPNRIIGIHDADLRLRNADGGPRYPGLRAVRDAIRAGESETRSTVYLLTPKIDAGPPLLVSDQYPVRLPAYVRSGEAGIGTYVAVHRERMIMDCWGPLIRKTVEVFAEERLQVTLDGRVFVDGNPAPMVLSAPKGQLHTLREVS